MINKNAIQSALIEVEKLIEKKVLIKGKDWDNTLNPFLNKNKRGTTTLVFVIAKHLNGQNDETIGAMINTFKEKYPEYL